MAAARLGGIALASAVLFSLALSSFEAVAEPLRLGVASASVGYDQRSGQAVVAVRLADDSRRAFADFTRANLGQPILRIDGNSMMKPIVREPITGGGVQIPIDNPAEAERLAARLNNRTAILEVEAVPR